ncbi:hypothetical protein ACWEOE_33350 [Amycolatopsis sp. NPDC004368]
MRTVLHGELRVHYGQCYVHGDGGDPFEGDLSACFTGQRNGLCGAAVRGTLFLITGVHTGNVGFTLEVHESEPPETEAEEVVEVSFRVTGATRLVTWGGEGAWDLGLAPGDYRVRYSGTAMDAAREHDTRLADEPELDRYLLQFWPARPAPDAILRQTSAVARYWHGVARELPPPPTPEERAEAEEARRRAEERARANARHQRLVREWGGVLPDERILALPPGSLREHAKHDRDLVVDLLAAPPEARRAFARWVAHRAFEHAGLDTVPWIAEGLRALDAGEPLPRPFDDWHAAWDHLLSDPAVPRTLVPTPDGRHDNALQQAMAFPAIFAATEPDSLAAAGRTLSAARVAFGEDRAAFFAKARAEVTRMVPR